MLRIRTALMIALFVAIADAATKSNPSTYSYRLVFVIACLAAWYVFSTSVNDLADEEIDQINLKGYHERPLANKQTTRSKLWNLGAASALATILFALPLGATATYAAFGGLILSYIYSMPPLQISHHGFVATTLLPLGYIALPCVLVLQANNAILDDSKIILFAALYISFMGRIILKDFRDVIGDRKFGKRTFIVRHGAKATCAVSGALFVVGSGIMMYRFRAMPLLAALLLPYTAIILFALRQLSLETRVKRQVSFVGLVGRLANGAALLAISGLYYELERTPNTILYSALFVGVALFGLSAAYALYAPLLAKK